MSNFDHGLYIQLLFNDTTGKLNPPAPLSIEVDYS